MFDKQECELKIKVITKSDEEPESEPPIPTQSEPLNFRFLE